jgi:hypothetical protein
LRREANILPPCKSVAAGKETVKVGGRDAAIWLSAVEYAREHPDETVYFVSSNTKDFGHGNAYEYPMDEDLADLESRFIHLTSLDQVLSRFAQPTKISKTVVHQMLSKRAAQSSAKREAETGTRPPLIRLGTLAEQLAGESPLNGMLVQPDWDDVQVAIADTFRNFRAYTIGESEWCTVGVRWFLAGVTGVRGAGGGAFQLEACVWETQVLLSVGDEPRLVVLRSTPPKPVTSDDAARFGSRVAGLGQIESNHSLFHWGSPGINLSVLLPDQPASPELEDLWERILAEGHQRR